MDTWQRAMGLLLLPAMKSLYRLQAEGIENLPTEGGYVLASNHLSNFDPWVLAYPLWPRRRLRSMAKAELFNPLLAPLLRASGAFPVRRGGSDRDAYRTAIEVVRSARSRSRRDPGARTVGSSGPRGRAARGRSRRWRRPETRGGCCATTRRSSAARAGSCCGSRRGPCRAASRTCGRSS